MERVARRVAELELLVDVVARLADALRATPVQAEGFRSVGRELEDLRRTPEFAALERELPSLRATLASVARPS